MRAPICGHFISAMELSQNKHTIPSRHVVSIGKSHSSRRTYLDVVDEGGVVMLLVESDLHLLWAARRPQFKRGLVGLSTMFPRVP